MLTNVSSVFTNHKGREWHPVSIRIHFIVHLLNVYHYPITILSLVCSNPSLFLSRELMAFLMNWMSALILRL